MKLEVGKSYVTRDGERIVRILATDRVDEDYPVIGAIRRIDSRGEYLVVAYTPAGRYYTNSEISMRDLVAEYVEPKKPKKLLAYRDVYLQFTKVEWFEDGGDVPVSHKRAPEYDREV
jgi:hypothetical protein